MYPDNLLQVAVYLRHMCGVPLMPRACVVNAWISSRTHR